MQNLTGLDNITTIGGSLLIESNNYLTSISDLNNLNFIGEDLSINDNIVLPSLMGLDNLTNIQGNVSVSNNDDLENLIGINNIISIGGNLEISENNILSNIMELENITSIGGNLSIENNDALSSLTGLGNIEAASIIGLNIIDNLVLSDCDVWSICDYLTNPSGNITISNNALGCNSPEEVEAGCLTEVNKVLVDDNDISIYPNPATKEIFIESNSGIKIIEINIFNKVGQNVLYNAIPANPLDISELGQGLYIIEIITSEKTVLEKLIVR